MRRALALALLWPAAIAAAHEQNDDLEDMRPAARALALAVRELLSGATLAEARRALRISAARPEEPSMPATIRVWRRRVDGSSSSCSGRVDVIPFDDYVRGVLPHEWFPSWDARALDMGALCVRTFAAFWVEAGGKYDCADLDDTTASQVYTDTTDPRTDAAVERTRGEVIVRDGSLVSAEYSAENGTPTKFGAVDPHCEGKTVNGHGRGTCQWGTQRWATLEGKDRFWMAAHYYPDATVKSPVAPGPAMAAAVVDVEAPATLAAGARGQVTVEVENTGSAVWDGGVLLATRAASRLAEPGTWLAGDRVTSLGHVEPGGAARVTFAVAAPAVTTAEDLTERFEVVADGDPPVWLAGGGADVRIRVVPGAAGGPPAEGGADLGDPTGGCQTGRGPGPGLALAVLGLLGVLGVSLRWRRRRRRGRGGRGTRPAPGSSPASGAAGPVRRDR